MISKIVRENQNRSIWSSGLILLLIVTLGIIQYLELCKTVKELQSFSRSFVQKRESRELSELKVIQNIPTLGFRNTISDWSFLKFLLYFGDDTAREVTGYAENPDFFEAIIQHDPYYIDFYIFLSGSVTNYSGLPERTVKIMEKGLENLLPNQPNNSYYVWRYKAADELLFLGEEEIAQKSYEMAAEWAAQSSDINSALMGRLSQQTADFLAINPDSKVAQINAWSSILSTALDDTTRRRAIRQIRELGGDVVAGSDGQIQVKYATAEERSGKKKPDS